MKINSTLYSHCNLNLFWTFLSGGLQPPSTRYDNSFVSSGGATSDYPPESPIGGSPSRMSPSDYSQGGAHPLAQPAVYPPSPQPTGYHSPQQDTHPSAQFATHPLAQPAAYPSPQPPAHHSAQPDTHPFAQPDTQPFAQPDTQPFAQPDTQPFAQPDTHPFAQPATHPLAQPAAPPAASPTGLEMHKHNLENFNFYEQEAKKFSMYITQGLCF